MVSNEAIAAMAPLYSLAYLTPLLASLSFKTGRSPVLQPKLKGKWAL